MLGPFRISNLPPRSPRRAAAGSPAAARRPGTDGVVLSVNGDKYEQYIRSIPGAKLKYTDADKDVITVGSKHELEDRLAEPIRKLSRTAATKEKRGTDSDTVPLRPASPAMHVFEIDPIEAAVQLWQRIEQESNQPNTRKIIFGVDDAAPEPERSLSSPPSQGGLTLEEKQAVHFKNSLPPQISDTTPVPSNDGTQRRLVNQGQSSSSLDASNVLTPKGIMQAQQAGEQLRARLGNPGPRIDRANAVNSWATYSQKSEPPTPQQQDKVRSTTQSPSNLPGRDTSAARSFLRPSSMGAEPAMASSISQPIVPGSSHDNDAHLSEAVHGSLLPAFYDNVQASLAKLSPDMTTLSGEALATDRNAKAENNDSDKETTSTDDEKGEAAEITLTKMVFASIREMADVLAKMNSQFDAQLTPKLVSERLKSKDRLLPIHRQDTVRDLFTVRRGIEEFALEVAETKQTLARLEDTKVFPESTNMVDFNSMTAATYVFGRLVRSMDDLIIAARRGMLPAQLEDGESKFHIPRRLAREGYEDMWSMSIYNIPSRFSEVDVRNLVSDARHDHGLKTIELREIILHEGPPEKSAEFMIAGTDLAQETWRCLVSAPFRSCRLRLSKHQVGLFRKHYPTVYSGASRSLKEKDQSPTVPPSRADIDVARLKALQDRRATWRKEFKARTQSVRFNEYANVIDDKAITDKKAKAPDMSTHSPTADLHLPDEPSKLPQPDLFFVDDSQKHRRGHSGTLRASRSDWDLKHTPRRSLRPVQSQNFAPEPQPASSDCGATKSHHATYHSIKYPPGPFPPAPPKPSSMSPVVPVQSSISLPPIASLQSSFSLPPIAQPKQERPQSFQLPALTSAFPVPQSSGNDKKLPPFVLPQVKYPQVNQQLSDASLGPLPSFPALEPVRSKSVKRPDDEPKLHTTPGAWPDSEVAESESSGTFFRRMMGRSPAPADPVSPMLSPVLGASQPSGKPLPWVSPIASTTEFHRPATIASAPPTHATVRRSATVATAPSQRPLPTKSAGGPWSRRPYSQTFDGAGRFNLDASRNVAPQSSGGSSATASARPASMPPRQDHSTPIAVALDSETPSDWAKIQYCVNQLKELGYGDVHNGGMDRLAMYAQLADGDIEATIDLIEEERQAWNEKEDVSANSPTEAPPPARDI